jgi:hypothetical protein
MDAASRSPKKPELIDRRDVMSRGLRAAYVVPAILAVVKATERPAYAQVSGGLPPTDGSLFPTQPPTAPPPNGGPFDPTGPPSPFYPAPPGDETITHHAPLPDGLRTPFPQDGMRPPFSTEGLRQRPPSQ